MNSIDSKTKLLAVIGDPIEHSFSPKMHNYISKKIEKNYVYTAFKVDEHNLKQALDGMRAMGICGFNVTAPHKKNIMKYLDEISDSAKLLDSVNTVVNQNGKLIGYNTDSDGFYASLEKANICVQGKHILVIGAGGVASPTIIRLIKEDPSSITVVNRTQAKAQTLAASVYKKTGFKVKTSIDSFDFDIVINTTSAGMAPYENLLPTDSIDCIKNLDFINSNTAVIDLIYNPEKTLFLQECEKRGAKILNGLGMLIYQGIFAYELFTSTKLDDSFAESIKREVFNR